MHRVWWGRLALVLLLPMSVAAQSASTNEREQEMQEMRARIEKLERLVAELQKEKDSENVVATAASEPVSAPAAPSPSPAQHEDTAASMDHSSGQGGTPSVIERRFPALHFRGFGDVDFAGTDAKGTKSGFNMGQLILHMSSPLSEKVSVFGETSFTAQAGPTATAYNVDVERLLIRYDYNDFFKLSFGRYHTPINYWNTAFHHGLWLQTTIARPEMIRFGGRFLPVHFIGMQAEGNIPSGPIGLGYNAGLGNGRSGNIARGGDSGDVNNNRAWVVNLFARPAALNGLQVGGAVYGDLITVSPALTGNPQFRELITSASVLWTKETPEFLAEFAHVRHRNTLTQQEFNNNAAYVQIAYRLPGEAHKWKPYYRFEWSNINPSDPLFTTASQPAPTVTDLTGSTVGVRYDISNFAAFKAEYRHTARRATDPVVNGFFLQTSFTF
jgi:DNA-binding protein H-NS